MQDAVSIWVSKFGRLLHFHVVRNRTIVYLVLDRYVSRRYLPHSELMHATHSAFSLKHFCRRDGILIGCICTSGRRKDSLVPIFVLVPNFPERCKTCTLLSFDDLESCKRPRSVEDVPLVGCSKNLPGTKVKYRTPMPMPMPSVRLKMW